MVDALIVLLLIAGTGVVALMIGVSPVGTALLVAVGYEVGLVRWRGQTVGKMVEAARNRGFWLCWRSVWGSCYEDSPGCVVVIVGEPVGDSS